MSPTRRQFLKCLPGCVSASTLDGLLEDLNESLIENTESWDPEILAFINVNKDYIAKSAEKYKLPEEFLASILYIEKTKETLLSRTFDSIMSLFGQDVSLGDGQIKISAAATADGKDYRSLTEKDFQFYRRKLMEIPTNIDYVAKNLRFLLNRPNRYPNITAEELINNPHAMAIAATEYNLGPRNGQIESAKSNFYGFDVIAGLIDSSPLYKIFGRKQEHNDKIRAYIESNKKLAYEAKRNSDIEENERLGNRLTIVTTIGILGLAFYLTLSKIREKQ